MINDYFEFVGAFVGWIYGHFKFFGWQTEPIYVSHNFISARSFNGYVNIVGMKCIYQGIQIIHGWFAARDHHKICFRFQNGLQHGVDTGFWMQIFVPTFFHITPNAAHITTANAQEIRRATAVFSFTLNGVEMLHQGVLNSQITHYLNLCFSALSLSSKLPAGKFLAFKRSISSFNTFLV